MSLYSSVPCSEEYDSRSENAERGTSKDSPPSASATVVLRCAWGDRWALIEDILGNLRSYPDEPLCVAKNVSGVKGVGVGQVDGQAQNYEHALVTVNYSTLTSQEKEEQEQEGVEIFTERLEPTAEFITLDHKLFQWGDSNDNAEDLEEGEAPGKLQRGLALCRDWKNLRFPPPEILDLVGHCNEDGYFSRILGLYFEAETLLYVPPQMQRAIRTDEVEAFSAGMKFMFKPQGWNKFWRAKTQTWERIYLRSTDGDEPPVQYDNYPKGNLGVLLGG